MRRLTCSDNYCNCGLADGWFDNWDPSEVWVDLIVILDTSESMGDSLEEVSIEEFTDTL